MTGTLLTIFLTPRLQHFFWTRQRRFELCLASIKEIDKLASVLFEIFDKTTNYKAADPCSGKAWFAVAMDAKNLFSAEALRRFSYLDDLMVDLSDTAEKPAMTEEAYAETVDALWDARTIATRALYKDIGIRPRGDSWRVRVRSSALYRSLRKLMKHPVSIDEEAELVYGPEIREREKRRGKFASLDSH